MIVGIDLGTCFSAIGWQNSQNQVELIPNFYGNRITPSAIAVSKDEILIGDDAILNKNNEEFVFVEKTKTDIGSLVEYYTPQGKINSEDVAMYILKYIKKYAEEYTGQEITGSVVTVPAYFSATQRKITKSAAERAGISVLRIISEPTAASLNVEPIKESELVLVYDLGGGTFDSSILQMHSGLARVIATNGNVNLGGKDFDEILAKHLFPNIENLNIESKNELVKIAEDAKKALTNRDNCICYVNKIDSKLQPYSLSIKEYNQLIKPLIDKTKQCIFNCLKDAELEPENISRVLLVGGSTRLRYVKEILNEIFTAKIETIGNPDESVALGATYYALDISGKRYSTLLVDVIPMSIGVRLDNGMIKRLIRRNSPIPSKNEELFTTAYDYQKSVTIEVYQGENEIAENNHHIGTLVLSNIQPGLKAEPKIKVSFNIDQNAVLSVQATDMETESVSESTFEYNLEAKNIEVDEELQLNIIKQKQKLQLIKLKYTDNLEKIELINGALQTNNLEFITSTIDDLS